MEFQEVFAQLRQRTGLSQSEVAERLFVTRQAVSRWERDAPGAVKAVRCVHQHPAGQSPDPGLPELWNAAER